MDQEDRLARLEADLAQMRDRALAAEIVANLFHARVLNLCEQIGDDLDLDAVLPRLADDMAEAKAKAATPAQVRSWSRIEAYVVSMITEIRDARRAFRPANES